ncbi:MAG: twin-arginine translocase subunit TatB [Gammaproteobacteria bacterium]|nr:MAG: twin-arginine translocase subunit TatB [Gammaproteobacteria bacterium]
MFDVGFWELAIIMIVALLVIGPERLPRVARTVGLWLGRARSAFNNVKADIDRELRAEELKTMLTKQVDVPELKQFRDELTSDVASEPSSETAKPTVEPSASTAPSVSAKPGDDERG